jgi:tight adherence protein B
MPEPIGSLFKTAYDEQTLGLSMKDALSRLSDRIPSIDLHLFLAAVDIHREVGGNLTETLERLANTIRERIKLRRQVRVYTAQGRLTGYILAALPIFMALFLYVTSPDYIGELVVEKEGKYAIGFVIAGQIIGFLVIKKLINIKI